MLNTMWSALFLICAVDAEGNFKEPRMCETIVSRYVWRSEEICMDQIAIVFNRYINLPQQQYSIRDYECFEWKRQRHSSAPKSEL